jgi:protein SCO1/2
LKAYAKKNQVNDAKWNLVTGDKRDIHAGQKILLGVKLGKPSELYDMVHTENFVWSTPKKEFVAFMTEQTKKTSNDLSKTLLLSTN